MKRAVNANIGDGIGAAEDQEIIDDVKKNGGQAILTGSHHKTGTDRIYEVINKIEKNNIDLIMNLQGDEPLMNLEDIKNLNEYMSKFNSNMGTLACKITEKKINQNENIVKVTTKESLEN